MLLVLLSWIVITAVFLSFGDITILLWNRIAERNDKYGLLNTFWIGFCSTGMLLSIISLFSPINSCVLAAFVVVAIINTCIRRTAFSAAIHSAWVQFRSLGWVLKGVIALAFLAVFIYSLSTPILFDFGLYHMQSIMWTESYSLIPGLGNLHGRFGFNSNFLLLSTMFGYHPEIYNPFFAINSLCVILFICWIVYKISKSESVVQQVVLSLILLLYALNFIKYVSSTSTDIVVHILIIYLLISLTLSNEKLSNKALLYAFVPIFCVTLKLSSAIIALLVVFVLIFFLKKKEYRGAAALVFLGLLIIIPWCIRFIVLTGYLVYPYPDIDLFSFDWKIPLQHVIDEKESATAWARIAHRSTADVMAMSFGEWFPVWLKALARIDLLLYILAAFSCIVVIIRRKTINVHYTLLAWSVALCGFIFGFITAPDPRFCFGFIICCGFIPLLGVANDRLKQQLVVEKSEKVLSFALCLLFIAFIGLGTRQVIHYQDKNAGIYSLVFCPQSVDNIKLKMNATFKENRIDNYIIYSPKVDNRCFDECLPCMPYFDDRIEMRGNSFQEGFRIKNTKK